MQTDSLYYLTFILLSRLSSSSLAYLPPLPHINLCFEQNTRLSSHSLPAVLCLLHSTYCKLVEIIKPYLCDVGNCNSLVMSQSENLSPHVLAALARQIKFLATSPPEGIKLIPKEGSLTEIHASIEGPGEFKLLLVCM